MIGSRTVTGQKRKNSLRRAGACAVLLACSAPAQAAEGGLGFSLLGSKTTMAGYLPGPGVYASLSNYGYFGDADIDYQNAGVLVSGDIEADAYLPLPTLRVTDAKMAGGNLAFSATTLEPASAEDAPIGGQATVNADATRPASWVERDTLTGDWGGRRTWLKEHGITIAPRLTQFFQGLAAGDGDHDFKYGGKADLLLNADLSKLGFWKGFSLTVHGEYNYGETINVAGGTLSPANTALLFPGMEGADAFDLSSVYFQQQFGNSVSLLFGKINMIDIAAKKPFMGGAGIDSFWNLAFTAPPTGVVPPYLFGALLSVRTERATFGLWVYDPVSVVNKSGFEEPFANGVTVRGSVDFPVTIGGLSGRQGFVALYSTESGADLNDIGDTFLPPFPPDYPDIKEHRYYFAYSFDQYLYRVSENSKEGVGLFGQVSISDGNPTKLNWSALVGIGGTGMIPGRSRDNWGIAFYYDAPSRDLKNSLSPLLTIRDEQGLEIFYNFAVTRWLTVGADLQVIDPSLGKDTVIVPGLRSVTRF